MSIVFKSYGVEDACYQHAWALRQQVLRTPLGISLTQQDRTTDKSCWHYGLFHGKQLLATVTIQPFDDAEQSPQQVQLRQMVVAPDHQNKGLGQILIKKTEQALQAKGVKKISLAARLPAVGFYQKLGFKARGPIYHHLRIDHRDMVKKLKKN